MRHTLFIITLAAALSGATYNTNAQDNSGRTQRRTEMQARQVERMAKELNLDDSQRAKFDPIYKAYLAELAATRNDEARQHGDSREKDPKSLTDEEAAARLATLFDRQEQQLQQQQQRLAIQRKYASELVAVLTPRQLLKVFTPKPQNRQGAGQMRPRQGGGARQGFGGQRGGFGGGEE